MSLPTINSTDIDSAPVTLVQTKGAAAGTLVVMDCGDFSLGVPSQDIVSLLSCKELMQLPDWEESCGCVSIREQHYPVFCISKSLQLQKVIAQEHQAIVLLAAEQYFFALSCCHVSKIELSPLQVFSCLQLCAVVSSPFLSLSLLMIGLSV